MVEKCQVDEKSEPQNLVQYPESFRDQPRNEAPIHFAAPEGLSGRGALADSGEVQHLQAASPSGAVRKHKNLGKSLKGSLKANRVESKRCLV
jgi:hypothetical protein